MKLASDDFLQGIYLTATLQNLAKSEKNKIFWEGYGKDTGIGLGMIQIMCNLYGWDIQETGKKGKGAQFTITIPKKPKTEKQHTFCLLKQTKEITSQINFSLIVKH